MIASSGSSGRHAENRAGDEKRNGVPPKRSFRERVPDQRYGRTLGKRTVAAVAIDGGPRRVRRQRSRSRWEMDYTSLDGSRGTGSASWSIRDPGCPSWLHGHGGNGVARRTG